MHICTLGYLIFKKTCVCVWVFCLRVCMCIICVLVLTEVQRWSHWILWNWSRHVITRIITEDQRLPLADEPLFLPFDPLFNKTIVCKEFQTFCYSNPKNNCGRKTNKQEATKCCKQIITVVEGSGSGTIGQTHVSWILQDFHSDYFCQPEDAGIIILNTDMRKHYFSEVSNSLVV